MIWTAGCREQGAILAGHDSDERDSTVAVFLLSAPQTFNAAHRTFPHKPEHVEPLTTV